ncbi:MAG: hypothetical protein WBO10_03175 [Pyrinomonadaceae bacterium]
MELKFDKEIDVLLRKSRDDRGVLVGDAPPEPKKHLDADAIAAFVENAVPNRTRSLYMEHFADCDPCRKLLSQNILMNQTAVATTAEVVAAPVAAGVVPWYQRLFRTPNIAIAMGALVLAFSGVLGFLLVQNRESSNATISQVGENEMQKPASYSDNDTAAAAPANIAANAVAETAETDNGLIDSQKLASKPAASPGGSLGENKADTFGRLQPESDKEFAMAEKPSSVPKPVTAAPPPAPGDDRKAPASIVTDGADSRSRAEESKDEDTALAKRKASESRRDLPASPVKAGPTRGAGPVQNNSNQVNNQVFEMAVTRVVGGKTFENRDGAWYDRAYKNQKTNNYRRATDDYKKLDRGLRSIADNLGGTVVMMWKDKAYRIQ